MSRRSLGPVLKRAIAGFLSGILAWQWVLSSNQPELLASPNQDLAEAQLPQDEPPTTLDPEVQRRVRLLQRQLNADDLAQREQAERDMVAMGTKLLDYLPTELEIQGAELRERLTRVRLTLESLAAAEVTKPISINLKGEFTAQELLERIQQQTSNPTVTPTAEAKITVDWQDKSYWQAIDEVADRLKLSVVTDRGAGITLQPNEFAYQRQPLAAYHGAFRASPLRWQRTRDLTSSVPALVNFTMMLEWEPKLRVIRLDLPLDTVQIVSSADPTVTQVVGGEGQKVSYGVGGEQRSSTVSLAMPDLSDVDPEAVDIVGKFNLLVAGREETFRFTDLKTALDKKQQLEKSGIKVQLEEVVFDDHLMLIKVGIQFSDAKQSLESHFGWIYQNAVEVIDKDGIAHPYLTIESGGRREQGLALVYLFDRFEDLDGYSFVYRSPGILIEIEVPFRLTEIPVK